ncbi:MAG TPA: M3 family oligoendopeptidase [Candidatus Kapabacteria bacterium]|nr:M3 family oligoendopeptidase [Candidatus Kapabacteria bacterium]
MQYKHYPNRPEKLEADYAREEYKGLIGRIDAAEASESSAEWVRLFADWNALKSYINAEGSRISFAQSRDMSDPVREEADRYYREEVTPVADEGSSRMVNALLKSRHRAAVAERFGGHLVRVLETTVEPLAPVNSELRVKASDLVNRYEKTVAAGEVTINGRQVTLAVARNMQSAEDAETRRQAFEAYRQWFLDHRTELGGIYDAMVKLRDQMGRNLGHENYIPLGYLAMGRTDYGAAEAAKFRDSVRRYAVPLQKKLYEQQAHRLGMQTLRPWDSAYDPALTLPAGVAPVETQLEKAQRVFDQLSPDLAEHFTRMRQEGLIDLENRKGKQAGAYCTSFSDEGRVAIFCNSTGDQEDVGTLMHEMGHAFQGWESQPIESVDLQWPTSDACEIHSMGMEYLSMRFMTEFFTSEHAEKFRRHRWKDAVELLCYICIVDEFQHWVYEHATATMDERDAAWDRIWDVYKDGLDFNGVEAYKHARWYAQGHIFASPFYYIDYAIAETGAMQLALIDAEDHAKALDIYLNLCRIGGTMSVLNIFKTAGLRSPFDPEVMRDLMAHAARELGIEESVAA